ncbi:MAG: PDZ domain-containing protein [Sediminicola sp.]|tara:strand:- start:101201 stop:103006 length:1806 start_codon:yes stop_codon:yes gene_type:complete
MKNIFAFCLLLYGAASIAQTNSYEISFENAVHHEAEIKITFPDISSKTVDITMSRSSPGRYALHEFAKNVYNFKATDSQGTELTVSRPDPYRWTVTGHDGTVHINYTLFADRADGTYSQIDQTHAHLNMPATFMYVADLAERPIDIVFNVREDLGWKVATQLQNKGENGFSAPNLDYFMDSPTEISNFSLRQFEVESNQKNYTVQFVLHHEGTEAELDTYFEKVKKVVLAEKEVFGELPDYDYGTYTFLACYLPHVSGDGMEHRNSTILTDREGLADGGMEGNIGTVSHEFFHSWNVERIRPKALQPFNFSQANMSGELWFAEGFTSYYTNLILCRAGIISPQQYIEGLTGTFNYVWNSPARKFFGPIGMSYQAPFVDAATSVDPANRENTFISYYSYGSVLGLALDLSLRTKDLNLDDYMKLVWEQYGKKEVPYTINDLHQTLNSYAGKEFGDHFFEAYIFKSGMPDYAPLFAHMGVSLVQDPAASYFGAAVSLTENGVGLIERHVGIGTPAYLAGLEKGDTITSINDQPLIGDDFGAIISKFAIGDALKVGYKRFGQENTALVKLTSDPQYKIGLMETTGTVPSKKILRNREQWLKARP